MCFLPRLRSGQFFFFCLAGRVNIWSCVAWTDITVRRSKTLLHRVRKHDTSPAGVWNWCSDGGWSFFSFSFFPWKPKKVFLMRFGGLTYSLWRRCVVFKASEVLPVQLRKTPNNNISVPNESFRSRFSCKRMYADKRLSARRATIVRMRECCHLGHEKPTRAGMWHDVVQHNTDVLSMHVNRVGGEKK